MCTAPLRCSKLVHPAIGCRGDDDEKNDVPGGGAGGGHAAPAPAGGRRRGGAGWAVPVRPDGDSLSVPLLRGGVAAAPAGAGRLPAGGVRALHGAHVPSAGRVRPAASDGAAGGLPLRGQDRRRSVPSGPDHPPGGGAAAGVLRQLRARLPAGLRGERHSGEQPGGGVSVPGPRLRRPDHRHGAVPPDPGARPCAAGLPPAGGGRLPPPGPHRLGGGGSDVHPAHLRLCGALPGAGGAGAGGAPGNGAGDAGDGHRHSRPGAGPGRLHRGGGHRGLGRAVGPLSGSVGGGGTLLSLALGGEGGPGTAVGGAGGGGLRLLIKRTRRENLPGRCIFCLDVVYCPRNKDTIFEMCT